MSPPRRQQLLLTSSELLSGAQFAVNASSAGAVTACAPEPSTFITHACEWMPLALYLMKEMRLPSGEASGAKSYSSNPGDVIDCRSVPSAFTVAMEQPEPSRWQRENTSRTLSR